MPRYLVERTLGAVSPQEFDAAAEHSTQVREERYPEITWQHTHVVSSPEGVKAFCVYESSDADSLRRYSAEAGLPVDRIHEVTADLVP
jgi:hypothetical protein